jgi:acetyltransferase-like isoleucine patch superfamily enzyme
MNISDTGEANEVVGAPIAAEHVRVAFKGTRCRLIFGENVTVAPNTYLEFNNFDQVIEIEDGAHFSGYVHLMAWRCRLRFGARSRANAPLWMNIGEKDDFVNIGADCLFADARFRTSDSHKIFDRATSERINPSSGITVEDNCWLAESVLCLGGAHVGTGSVVGARSIVTGRLEPHTLSVGSPAKTVRSNISWQP